MNSFFEMLQIDPIAGLIGIAAFAIGALQLKVNRASNRQSDTILSLELRREWMDLKEKWHTAILVVEGPDSYYTPAEKGVREEYLEVIKYLDAPIKEKGVDNWREGRIRSHKFQQASRDCIFFFDSLALATLSGKLSPQTAYSIVGPEIPRRSRQIRLMLGEGARQVVPHNTYFNVGSYPGLTDRIFALLDILWAEAARTGDLEHHELVGTALHKRYSGSGIECRLRIRRLVKETSKGPIYRRFISLKLDRHLLWSQFVKSSGPRDSLDYDTPTEVSRKSKFQKFKEWVIGLIFSNP